MEMYAERSLLMALDLVAEPEGGCVLARGVERSPAAAAMTAHVCGAFDQPLVYACCACCGGPVFDVLETIAEGPLAGQPARIGLMNDAGTQVEVMLSNGSIAHVAMCVPCATNLQPESLLPLWQTNIARTDAMARIAGKRDSQRRAEVRRVARLYPVGVIRWRRQDRDLAVSRAVPDGLVIDRRKPR